MLNGAAPVRLCLHFRLAFAILLPGIALAQPCETEEGGTVGAMADAVNEAAAAPDPRAAAFLAEFAETFGASGRADAGAIEDLSRAARGLADAERIAGMVKHDRELDEDEVSVARAALSRLAGSALSADLEAALGRALPPSNADVGEYALHFDLCGAGPRYRATATIRLERAAPSPLILEADPERLTIDAVKADGRTVPFETVDGRLVIDAPGAKSVAVDYRVSTTSDAAGYGLIKDRANGRFFTMTWPYRTGSLFPSNPDPADGVTSRVSARTCGGRELVATGHKEGDAFVSKKPSPAYSIALYAMPDFEHGAPVHSDHGPVTGYGSADAVSAATRERYRTTAARSLDFYSSWLGAYEYGEGLAVVELASGGLGGMEHVSAVAIMLDAARDPQTADEVAAHEVAHHWFGDNLRIASWPHFWMSEGFTDYSTWRYFRHAEGEAKYRSLLKTGRAAVKSQLASDPHPLRPPDATDIHDVFDSIPYEMGAWMLRMMEVKVGTAKFDEMLGAWYRENRFQAVTTEAFLDFASDRTGEDLHAFFDAWNGITELPRFDGTISFTGSSVVASLDARTDAPAGIAVPLTVEGAGGVTKTVMVDPSRPVSFDAGFDVVKATWDAEVTVLAEVRNRTSVAAAPP